MNASSAGNYNPDRPLTDPAQDRFGYAPFAQHLAASIVSFTTADGIVLAVYGDWGSGKSTVLNFVLHYVDQLDASDRIVPVFFNP